METDGTSTTASPEEELKPMRKKIDEYSECQINNSISGKNNNGLSNREKEILDWLKRGKSSWDISLILEISERTVNFHIYKIMQKLEVVSRPQAVAEALSRGLIHFD